MRPSPTTLRQRGQQLDQHQQEPQQPQRRQHKSRPLDTRRLFQTDEQRFHRAIAEKYNKQITAAKRIGSPYHNFMADQDIKRGCGVSCKREMAPEAFSFLEVHEAAFIKFLWHWSEDRDYGFKSCAHPIRNWTKVEIG